MGYGDFSRERRFHRSIAVLPPEQLKSIAMLSSGKSPAGAGISERRLLRPSVLCHTSEAAASRPEPDAGHLVSADRADDNGSGVRREEHEDGQVSARSGFRQSGILSGGLFRPGDSGGDRRRSLSRVWRLVSSRPCERCSRVQKANKPVARSRHASRDRRAVKPGIHLWHSAWHFWWCAAVPRGDSWRITCCECSNSLKDSRDHTKKPATIWRLLTQGRCATRLRYAPTLKNLDFTSVFRSSLPPVLRFPGENCPRTVPKPRSTVPEFA